MNRIDASNAHLHQDGFVGKFYIRSMRLEPGEMHKGEDHHIDHATFIREGPVTVRWRNPRTGATGEVEITESCKLDIPAEVWHTFVAHDKVVKWECWFAESDLEALLPWIIRLAVLFFPRRWFRRWYVMEA